MKNKYEFIKTLRIIVSLLLVGCYFVGLIAMLTFSFSLGLVLWVISTVGGIGLLYCFRTLEKRAQEVAEAEKNAEDARKAAETANNEGDNNAACE